MLIHQSEDASAVKTHFEWRSFAGLLARSRKPMRREHVVDIIDHKFTSEAVKFTDRYVYINGRRYLKRSTKGVLMNCQFKDG